MNRYIQQLTARTAARGTRTTVLVQQQLSHSTPPGVLSTADAVDCYRTRTRTGRTQATAAIAEPIRDKSSMCLARGSEARLGWGCYVSTLPGLTLTVLQHQKKCASTGGGSTTGTAAWSHRYVRKIIRCIDTTGIALELSYIELFELLPQTFVGSPANKLLCQNLILTSHTLPSYTIEMPGRARENMRNRHRYGPSFV